MGALIWLASYPKSGNTWMRAYLHNLLRNPPRPAAINELDQFCLGESNADWYKGVTDTPPEQLTNEEVMAFRPKVHEMFTRVHPDSVFVKTHNYLGEWHGQPMHNMNVTAGAIYVVRNPLDVVLSMTSHFGVDLDGAIDRLNAPDATTDNMGGHVPEYHADWSTHVKSWTQQQSQGLLVVRYEDMLDKPFKTFLKVAKFLGLNPPKDRVTKAVQFSSFKELKKQESKEGFKERSQHAQSFFRSGQSGGWRQQLSDEQIARICEANAEQMARFNYLPKQYRDQAKKGASA